MRNRIRLILALALTSLIAIPLVAQTCPLGGTAKGARIEHANELKNRSAIPTGKDFDPKYTLAAVLAPGNDNTPPRWNEKKAGHWIGYVHNAKPGGIETVNCGAKAIPDRDTHIEFVLSLADSLGKRRVIAEITPRMRKWAKAQGMDWSTPTLEKTLIGHKVEIVGWAFNDFEHAPNAENTHPGNKLNWRATTWEIHPITGIKILDASAAASPRKNAGRSGFMFAARLDTVTGPYISIDECTDWVTLVFLSGQSKEAQAEFKRLNPELYAGAVRANNKIIAERQK